MVVFTRNCVLGEHFGGTWKFTNTNVYIGMRRRKIDYFKWTFSLLNR